jgi:hypothetical protein
MMLAQTIKETKAKVRTGLKDIRLILFLLVALLTLSSTNAIGQDDGVSWKVNLDASNSGKVAITVNPMNMQSGLYVTAMKCKVRFFDANGEQIGARVFNYSSVSPGSLFAKAAPKKKLFNNSFSSATSVKGDDMTYKIFRVGGKADGGQEFVKNGRVGSTP